MPSANRPLLNKGLNLLAADDALPEESTPDCGNVFIDAGGNVSFRGGSVEHLENFDIAAGATNEFYTIEEEFYKETIDGTQTSQLMATGGSLYRITEKTDHSAYTFLRLATYTTRASALAPERPYGVFFQDTSAAATVNYTVVCVSGVSSPLKTVVGGAATTVTHADWTASGEYPTTCAAYKSRMWYAGNKAHPNRIWVTRLGYVADFTTPGTPVGNDAIVIDLQLTDGGRITGLKHLYDLLLVFTTRGIYRISGSDASTFTSVFVSPLVATNQHALVAVDDQVLMMTDVGIFNIQTSLTYGDIKIDEMAPMLAPMFEGTQAWRKSGAFGVYDRTNRRALWFFEHEYTFADGTSITPNISSAQASAELLAGRSVYPTVVGECISYDLRGEIWSRHFFDFPINFANSRDEGTGTYKVEGYHKASTAGIREYELFQSSQVVDTINTVSTDVDSYFDTKKDVFTGLNLRNVSDGLWRRKTRLFAYYHANTAATITLSASHDGSAYVTVGTSNTAGDHRHAITGSCRRLQLRYASIGDMQLDSYLVHMKVKGAR